MSEPVSVIIPCHNAAQWVLRQVQAVLSQLEEQDEIVAVDNRSTDGTGSVLQAIADRDARVRVVSAPDRAGANYARNVGMTAAAHDLFLFCDADDVVSPGWVRALRSALPDAGIVGGTATPVDENGTRLASDLALHEIFGGPQYPLGASMGLSRTVYNAVGGFDESFVGGHDETDLAWRAAAAGWPTALVERAHISYVQRPSLDGTVRQRRNYARTAIQLWARHPGIVDPHGVSIKGALRGVARALPIAFRIRRGLASPHEAARWGWATGILEGHLRYRLLGRPPQPSVPIPSKGPLL